jgi:hypothetical protein
MEAMCSLDVKLIFDRGVEFQVLGLNPPRVGLVLQYLKDQPTKEKKKNMFVFWLSRFQAEVWN